MNTSSHSMLPRHGSPQEAAAGGAGLRAFTKIAELWHLSIPEQLALLGIGSRSTYHQWRKEPQPKLPRDTLVQRVQPASRPEDEPAASTPPIAVRLQPLIR